MQIDRLLRSNRKTLALYVRKDGSVEVRAPKRLSRSTIQQFVDSKTDWIQHQRSKLKSAEPSQTKHGYANGSTVWFLGQILTLTYDAQTAGQISISGGKLIIPAKLKPEIEHYLVEFYRKQARRILNERAGYFANQNGLRYSGIRINSARTRWGSCGARNRLNFPYRLIMAPMEIIDYVVVHELVHTVVRNHGSSFWAKVTSLMPDYHLRRKWLQTNGHLFDLAHEADPDRITPIQPTKAGRRRIAN